MARQTAATTEELLQAISDPDVTEIELDENAIYAMKKPLVIMHPVTIHGNDADLVCEGATAILVASSGVLLHSMSISGGTVQVMVDALGQRISDIRFQDMIFLNYTTGIWVGSSVSNSSISELKVIGCKFIKDDESIHADSDITLTSATSKYGEDLQDNLLEHVEISGNFFSGCTRCNILGIVALNMNAAGDSEPDFLRCLIRHIIIQGNQMSGAYDTAVAHMANYIRTRECQFDYVDVLDNKITYGITGISSTAASPMKGEARGVCARHIRYIGNVITEQEGGCGEPDTAIALDAAQLDYYSSSSYGSLLEDIEIRDNVITGATYGVRASAAHSMLDADPPCEMKDNVLSNLRITGNTLCRVDECFLFAGARIEGRRTDWNWGTEHKMQYWQKPIKDHHKVTMDVSGNIIKNVLCEHNRMDGYRYACRITGVIARGHGIFTGNRACENITFRNNIGKNGEDHIVIAHTWLEDWARDGGGNQVDEGLKESFHNGCAHDFPN